MSGNEVAAVLARLDHIQSSMNELRDDFRDEKEAARQSRAVLHQRLDDQVEKFHALTVQVAVDAKTREALEGRVSGMEPTISEWRRIRAIGIGIGGVLAIGGISIASLLIWAGETVMAWLRHKLGIS